MNLHKLILTRNDCYKAGRTIVPKGVMVHSTGSNNPYLRRYVGPDDGLLGRNVNNNHWNMSGTGACVHAFIGRLKDGSIATYQTLPWDMRGWHCGRSGNDTHISFEICEDGLADRDYFAAVYREAVELTAYLCRLYSLDPLEPGVVLCHQEGFQRGIASNHGDVFNWFPRFGKTMGGFRADVAREMKGEADMNEEQVRKIVRDEIARAEKERAEAAPSGWEANMLPLCVEDGITDGTRPRSYATRVEVATMVRAGVQHVLTALFPRGG